MSLNAGRIPIKEERTNLFILEVRNIGSFSGLWKWLLFLFSIWKIIKIWSWYSECQSYLSWQESVFSPWPQWKMPGLPQRQKTLGLQSQICLQYKMYYKYITIFFGISFALDLLQQSLKYFLILKQYNTTYRLVFCFALHYYK